MKLLATAILSAALLACTNFSPPKPPSPEGAPRVPINKPASASAPAASPQGNLK